MTRTREILPVAEAHDVTQPVAETAACEELGYNERPGMNGVGESYGSSDARGVVADSCSSEEELDSPLIADEHESACVCRSEIEHEDEHKDEELDSPLI